MTRVTGRRLNGQRTRRNSRSGKIVPVESEKVREDEARERNWVGQSIIYKGRIIITSGLNMFKPMDGPTLERKPTRKCCRPQWVAKQIHGIHATYIELNLCFCLDRRGWSCTFYVAWVIILTVSRGYQSQKLRLFPFNPSLRGLTLMVKS